MIEKLGEIAEKLFSIGWKVAGALTIFELLRWLFSGLVKLVVDWINSKIDQIQGVIVDNLSTLAIDLTPGPQLQSYLAKANAVVPLDESWRLFLIYLAVASSMLGIKWLRNLLPVVK